MQVLISDVTLELIQGDITQQDTEAIVNAANSGSAGGGGVDGAIHRAGGPSIMEECRKIGRCPTGEARITRGGNLKARHVIHAVRPIYNNGKNGEAELLSNAYRNSLQLARDYHLASVSFPSLSTGAYRYPVRDAAKVALQTVATFLTCEEHEIELVRFVLFDEKTLRIYGEELKQLVGSA